MQHQQATGQQQLDHAAWITFNLSAAQTTGRSRDRCAVMEAGKLAPIFGLAALELTLEWDWVCFHLPI